MQYKIFGESLPAVTLTLNAGESIYTQSGGMTWMTAGVQMDTNMKGGLLKGLGRMLTGESLFIATYTATAANQEITIASTFPGAIVAIDPAGGDVIAQKSAFLCAEPGVAVSAHVVKNLNAGLFGGEGFVLQRLYDSDCIAGDLHQHSAYSFDGSNSPAEMQQVINSVPSKDVPTAIEKKLVIQCPTDSLTMKPIADTLDEQPVFDYCVSKVARKPEPSHQP